MYLIVDGKGYQVRGDKAYKVTFGIEGQMKVDENDFIEVDGQRKYTYDELVRRLNVRYMIEQAKLKLEKQKNESEEVKALREENEKLVSQIEELKNKIAELELENEELKKVPETQPVEGEEKKEDEVPETQPDEAKPVKKK